MAEHFPTRGWNPRACLGAVFDEVADGFHVFNDFVLAALPAFGSYYRKPRSRLQVGERIVDELPSPNPALRVQPESPGLSASLPMIGARFGGDNVAAVDSSG